MAFVLGLDGGATKTECVLMDEAGRVRARSRSGPSNPVRAGVHGALAAVCEACRVAVQSASISFAEVRVVCAGLAGTGEPHVQRRMQELLQTEFPGTMAHVCTDFDLTMEAMGEGPAIVLIAGTGSVAIGRNADGQLARAGGRGPLLGDEGSAYDIGQRAAMASLRAWERTGAESSLGHSILQAFGVTDWQEFQVRAHAAADEVFPKIFPLVAAAADAGDSSARLLLQAAADELATLVAVVMERLRFGDQSFSLAKSGGALGVSPFFDAVLDERLSGVAPYATRGVLSISPAEAAARLALRLLTTPAEGN